MGIAVVFVAFILLFRMLNSTSVIDAIYVLCSYTYGHYDYAALGALPAVHETKFLRHVRFERPLVIKTDGVKKEGVVMHG